jgi:Alr-MurF fusion protein
MKYTIEHIASIIKGSFLQFHQSAQIEQLLLDSRRLVFPDSSLFFALKGERREGHLYIEELYKRGLRNFVVNRPVPFLALPEANIIQVSDCLEALQQLASFHREQFDIPVIGITGSNGKTIVKEWLNQLLEDEYQIVRSPKSYNSQIGVPLSVWQMNETHELAIFEAGISRRGEMGRLEPIIRPNIGIFTNIGEAHSEGFENNPEKIMEKLLLFKGSRLLIYCNDQQETQSAIDSWRDLVQLTTGKMQWDTELFSWGRKASAILQVIAVQRTSSDTSIQLKYKDQDFSILIPFTDEASFDNTISCICLLLWLGKGNSSMMKKLSRLTPVAMRLELKKGINNCSIINDSYSADLSSLKIALDFLSQQQQHQKRTVILSDILQSGKKEEDLYREVAELLSQKKINRLLAIGPKIGAYHALFEQFIDGEIRYYSSSEALMVNFQQIPFRNETILIKGARVFEFEKIDRLLSLQVHQTVLEINLNAMAHNLKQYQRLLEPSTKLMAMVKAFAYGSGTYEIANLLQFHKVDWLAVAYADEGIQLRRAGIHLPIMVMNPEDNSFDVLLQYALEPVIYSFRLLKALDLFAKKQGLLQVPVHIELETGMNRLGFPLKDLIRLIPFLTGSSFRVQSVFTHLSSSEEQQQDAFTAEQASLFLGATVQIQQALRYPFLRHIANSAAIVRHPEYQLDMVRLGIGLYGIDPANTHRLDLQEVSTLKSTIAQIRQLQQGETVGYNRKGWIDKEATIATVRLGYADGYPRSLGNGVGKMWLKGKFVPTIGSICMDMTMIDITGVPGVHENDEITIFGNELSVQQLAHWAQTIPYEILTGISQRVKRVYFEE